MRRVKTSLLMQRQFCWVSHQIIPSLAMMMTMKRVFMIVKGASEAV